MLNHFERAGCRPASTQRLWVSCGALIVVLALALIVPMAAPAARAQGDQPPRDTLLITPTTQGVFHLPATGVILDIAYATVTGPVRLAVTFYGGDPASYTVDAVDASGQPLGRFEMPLIAVLPGVQAPQAWLIGWPGVVAAPPAGGVYLVVFDAHGIYSVPARSAAPGEIMYLGPLEHFTPALVQPAAPEYAASPPAERRLWIMDGARVIGRLPSAAHADRYRDRFLPEDLGNPGGWLLLGRADYTMLIDLARALRATIPRDADLPAPGALPAPLDLVLPFDCTADWAVTWGYHHSTPQNRFAVDFAPAGPDQAGSQVVYAAHAGRVYLKRYGPPDHPIDTGLAARVAAADGITSTVYGHLDPPGTLERWGLDPGSLPDYVWVEVGSVDQGQALGVLGRTGYATGPHIHVALWSWDQSLYQPVPFGPLVEFERGLIVPAAARRGCGIYRR